MHHHEDLIEVIKMDIRKEVMKLQNLKRNNAATKKLANQPLKVNNISWQPKGTSQSTLPRQHIHVDTYTPKSEPPAATTQDTKEAKHARQQACTDASNQTGAVRMEPAAGSPVPLKTGRFNGFLLVRLDGRFVK